jgi:UDP-3-O-[3-hydroxymyristoyl] glucosamine N-acyltransferase
VIEQMPRPFHIYQGPFKVKDLAQKLGLSYTGDGEKPLEDVNTLDKASQHELSFLDNAKYVSQLSSTQAAAVIVHEKYQAQVPQNCMALLSATPYADYAKALALFYPQKSTGLIHPTAVIEPSAKIGTGTSVGAGCYIGEQVEVGKNCIIEANVTLTYAHVGDETILHSGCVIGSDGFGFAFDGQGLIKVPQVGMVKIGSRVEVGACCTVDRGSLEDTIIEDDVKIDNLVQVAHNVKIGQGSQIVSQTGLAGSAKLGKGVVIGGQSGVVGHTELADGVMIAARSLVTKTLTEKGTYAGFPAIDMKLWRKQQAAISRLVKNKLQGKK